jgi:RNA polymerase sigma-70 factor (ECF subfamily)
MDTVTDDSTQISQWAEACRQGDREAFNRLVLLLHPRLRLHIAAFCDSGELVDEILQQTFISAFRRIETYSGRGSFLAWLQAISRNHLRMYWRARQRTAQLTEDVAAGVIIDTTMADLESPEAASHQSDRLAACLERLPERSRMLIRRRYLDSCPLNELAQQFKQSMETLSVTLHRIRRVLRSCMDTSP